jgi:hypothetical protein
LSVLFRARAEALSSLLAGQHLNMLFLELEFIFSVLFQIQLLCPA